MQLNRISDWSLPSNRKWRKAPNPRGESMATTTSSPMGAKIDIRHDHISPNPNNPRREAGDVSDLARSIRSEGIKIPLLVIPDAAKGNGWFLLEAGYRRWVASAQILEFIPCIVNTPRPGES